MARRAARTDANHKSISDFFKAHGCEVESLARLGNGVPDLMVTGPNWPMGRVALVEVKHGRGKKTPDQTKFAARFPVWVVRTDAEAKAVVKWLREK